MTLSRSCGRRFLLLGALLLVLGGCVQESQVNGERVFQYELWVPLTALFAGVLAVPIGYALRENTPRLGWGLVLFAPMIALFFVPSLFRDRVVVSDRGFHVRTGIWGLTAVHSIDFSNIKQIQITSRLAVRRRGLRTDYYLNCEKKSGGWTDVGMNNSVTRASLEAILEAADANGIPVSDKISGR
jgi:hypothetical protein